VTESSGSRASAANLTWHAGRMSREERWGALSASGGTIWFTGLSGSGKSTLAAAVELKLVNEGRPAYRLDGDNLRSGLNADLDFSRSGREENVRRVAEVACLFADAGVIALVALISPYRASREHARSEHERLGLPFVGRSGQLLDRLIPVTGDYDHNRLNNDTNAHAHLRAAVIGPSESIPLVDGRLALGTWQQVVLIDFDDRPRSRTVIVQVIS